MAPTLVRNANSCAIPHMGGGAGIVFNQPCRGSNGYQGLRNTDFDHIRGIPTHNPSLQIAVFTVRLQGKLFDGYFSLTAVFRAATQRRRAERMPLL